MNENLLRSYVANLSNTKTMLKNVIKTNKYSAQNKCVCNVYLKTKSVKLPKFVLNTFFENKTIQSINQSILH